MAADLLCPRCAGPLASSAIHDLCPACLAQGVDHFLNLAPPDPPTDLPPTVQGYELHAPLGIGGMGQVFVATELATGDRVAVKILAPRWTADEDAACAWAGVKSVLLPGSSSC